MTEEESLGHLALSVVDAGLRAYASHPVARAIVTVIPIVGSSFDSYVGTAGANLELQRLRDLIEELTARLERSDAARLDERIRPEDLIDATIRAVRAALETGDRMKLGLLVGVLVGSVSLDRPSEVDLETVVAALAALTPRDLEYARRFAESVVGVGRYAQIDWSTAQQEDMNTTFYLQRLQGAGLIDLRVIGGGIGGGPGMIYRFTPAFWHIRDLLVAGGDEFIEGAPS